MSDFKTRLVEEQVQLEDKLNKLKSLRVLMILKKLY